jgi:hypothetical protein
MFNNNNIDVVTRAHLLTWLNGRAADIYVHDKAAREPILLWSPDDGISIEDAIVQFCNAHKIDIEAETAG